MKKSKGKKVVVKKRTDKQTRLNFKTIQLVNKLDKTRKKSLNKKIFELLGELVRLREEEYKSIGDAGE